MNIKHISLAISAVAIASLIAACTKNQIDDSAINTGSAGLNGQLADLEIASVSSTGTKAVIEGTEFPQTGEIGLFLFKNETATQDYGTGYENIKYLYDSGKKKWTASPSIKVGSTPGYLYGYYPYNSGNTDITAIPVSSSLNGNDVMYASKQAEPITDATAANTAITMNHALARVSITVKNNGYIGDAKLTSIKFEGAKTAQTGTLNALDGSITATRSDDVTLNVTGDAQTITTAGTTYECLLVPSEVETNKQTVKITLTIDGQDKTATLSNNNGVIIAQGTKSNITITLSNTGITVQTVSVENWNVVEVGEYKVTVKLDADISDIKKDVWVMAYNDGDDVKIEAFSKSGQSLGCVTTGGASCATTKADNNTYTFTISGISSDVTAMVEYQRPTGLTLSQSSLTVSAGCSFRLSATVSPNDAYNKTCTWSSNNPDIATVDENGRVTAKAAGTAVITATTVKGGVTARCTTTIESYEPTLSKEFSVGPAGDNCKKVRFSRGNLKYTPSIDSWWFFDKQYGFGHDANALSLFTWGYGNWSTVWNTTSYQSGTFTDWGKQVGDGNTWRTLSSDEWKYLLEDRTDAADKVGFATVCEIKGIIVLPDEFVDPKTNGSTSDACVDNKFVPKASTGWEQNVYTAGDSWNKMEEAGALFLPAAGYRDGATHNANAGHYWSSTGSVPENAKHVKFISGGLWLSIDDKRSNGYSVRLVTE